MYPSPLGKEIYRTYDEYGPVQVFDDGPKRYLSFGDGDEQSCLLKAEPFLLQHDYTRAMLLPLLFSKPRDAVVVGLGGGALPSSLFHHWEELQLRAIELRPAVIKAAHRYFNLPRDARLQVINCDIAEYLDNADTPRTDLLLSDIYGAEGMDPQFFQPWYIEACHRLLSDDGWLVLNCWEEHREERAALESIAELFAEVYTCTVPSGNWIIMAARKRHTLNEDQLKAKAKMLSQKMGFSFMENLRRLYQIDLPTLEQARIG